MRQDLAARTTTLVPVPWFSSRLNNKSVQTVRSTIKTTAQILRGYTYVRWFIKHFAGNQRGWNKMIFCDKYLKTTTVQLIFRRCECDQSTHPAGLKNCNAYHKYMSLHVTTHPTEIQYYIVVQYYSKLRYKYYAWSGWYTDAGGGKIFIRRGIKEQVPSLTLMSSSPKLTDL